MLLSMFDRLGEGKLKINVESKRKIKNLSAKVCYALLSVCICHSGRHVYMSSS